MIYTTLKKVSNVCQAIDKRTYPATGTENVITFTHNGDGSYTANGIIISSDVAYLYIQGPVAGTELKLKANHKYIVLNGTNSEVSIFKVWLVVNNQLECESNSGDFYTYKPSVDKDASVSITIRAPQTGIEVNNFVFKPQLFDLTEMYGAGNEPTTVEQFRQDFPEELYDYKPYCFVKSYKTLLKASDDKIITSYKKSLACKTKNLFDYTKVNGLEHTSTGNPYSNYLKINGESFGVMVGIYDRGVNFIPHFILDAGTYTMSLTAKGTYPGEEGQFGIIKFNSDGTKPSFTKQWITSDSRQSYTFTLDENSEIAIRVQAYGNANNSNNLDSTFSNIQRELGDTATDYVPYNHL